MHLFIAKGAIYVSAGMVIVLALFAIIAYEALRAFVKERVTKLLTRSVKRYINEHHIKLDRFKFMNKFIVRQELMNDPEIHEGILRHAAASGKRIQDVEDMVEGYIEEIVPFFNLLTYYKMGWWIANTLLNVIYEVVIDRENAEKLKKIPPGHAVVFVMNHRSNIDYVLVAYMLAQNISISYAVGEWARVWPLEHIFKSFGAYFLRRNFREKLYHLVLEKYIQLISRQGVTQGIFIEGGLSRDGAFRDTKIGLIDYIMKIKSNPGFRGDIVFVPVGINYDWVLEDRVLIREWMERKEKSGFRDNIASLARVAVRGPFLVLFNTARMLAGRLRQHGYASVSFGDPVSASEFIRKRRKDFFSLERTQRLSVVKTFANELLRRIGEVVPVTPVCLVSSALLSNGGKEMRFRDLVDTVAAYKKAFRRDGRRIVTGRSFFSSSQGYAHLEREKSGRRKELVSFEEDMLIKNEAMTTVHVALDILKRRKIVRVAGGAVEIIEGGEPFLRYYANSIGHFFERK